MGHTQTKEEQLLEDPIAFLGEVIAASNSVDQKLSDFFRNKLPPSIAAKYGADLEEIWSALNKKNSLVMKLVYNLSVLVRNVMCARDRASKTKHLQQLQKRLQEFANNLGHLLTETISDKCAALLMKISQDDEVDKLRQTSVVAAVVGILALLAALAVLTVGIAHLAPCSLILPPVLVKLLPLIGSGLALVAVGSGLEFFYSMFFVKRELDNLRELVELFQRHEKLICRRLNELFAHGEASEEVLEADLEKIRNMLNKIIKQEKQFVGALEKKIRADW